MLALPLVQSFEALFRVPPQHRLVQVRSRSRGGLVGGTYWDHEEYDSGGRLIARFESFTEVGPDGRRESGWRKYDPLGQLAGRGPLDLSAASLETDHRREGVGHGPRKVPARPLETHKKRQAV